MAIAWPISWPPFCSASIACCSDSPAPASSPWPNCLPRLAHRGVRFTQARRHLSRQVAKLLHQLAERPSQRLLHALVGLALRCLVRRLGRSLVAMKPRRFIDAALRMVEQAALPADHVLHRAHLLPAALTLRLGALALTCHARRVRCAAGPACAPAPPCAAARRPCGLRGPLRAPAPPSCPGRDWKAASYPG